MKIVTQDIFNNAPSWVRSAAVDSTGDVYFYAVLKKELSLDSDECWWVYMGDKDNSQTYSPYDGYDTSNWKDSAIDRI